MKKLLPVISALLLFTGLGTAHAQSTAFTYQGRLNAAGAAVNGTYDFRFRLAADALGNTYLASPFLTNGLSVNNGLFLATIDFGAGLFNGSNYWLEVDVRTNGAGSYTALTPLQSFTPTPYAIFATTASNVSGTVSAAQVSGVLANGSLPSSPVFAGTITATAISGNGANVTNVNAATLGGLSSGNFWQLGGNNVAAGQFLGSTNSQPLELKANGLRVLRLDASSFSGKTVSLGYNVPNGAPNMIGGSPLNNVGVNVVGATIAGGGATNYEGAAYSNSIYADFGTIGGGYNNVIQFTSYSFIPNGSVIAGGYNNSVMGNAIVSVISGGLANMINTNAYYGVIVGGRNNQVSGKGAFLGGGGYDGIFGGNRVDADGAAIVGGVTNIIFAGAKDAFLGGGWSNNIQSGASGAVIAGGQQNIIQTNSDHAAIGGGWFSSIGQNAYEATIAGGYQNTISNSAAYATIGGGNFNTNSSSAGTIAGGQNNTASGTYQATVGGGYNNTASGNYATVPGGYNNMASGPQSFVGGGIDNAATNFYATVVGGVTNIASGPGAFVGGGEHNFASGNRATISGGLYNLASGTYATIPGGNNNLASGNYSFAAGYSAQATNTGSFVWSDTSGGSFTSTNANSFNARAAGGYRIYTSSSGATGAGVYLAAGGNSWVSVSDRAAKKNFQAVNYQAVLAKLAAVPVQQWNYNWEKDSDVPNLGPMAQDFKHAFYPGRDDTGISTLEFDGVELAAIQGLNQKMEAQRAENAALKAQLAELKQLVQTLAAKK